MKTILIVDDNSDVILSLKSGLEDEPGKYQVIGAHSGHQCFELLKNNQIPDIILLDIMMPEMSGWEVYDKLKEDIAWRNIPVMFLTARTDRIAQNAGRFLGDDYIEKPFEISDIKSRIEKALTSKKNLEEMYDSNEKNHDSG
ncbi:MAG: response regulator [Euryarchaeota archaeon]|nr:response regulator [Euryarchaeota archaeon]